MLRKVTVENGVLQGIPAADPRITAFKGVPFAAPPVGELRWMAPQPAKNWEGVYKADTFAPISMQETPGGNKNDLYTKEWHVDSDVPMSEDCLYLNVWTPAKSADEKLAVMVWIFGGGFQCGYPSEMEFDGERIARRGVILVSVNYRTNVFGFLAHPELTAKNPNKSSGNYGLLDQKAGIEWVKRNIAAFGGDPNRITIFGQSAGAGSVLSQISSPTTEGLISGAIMQSGGGLRSFGYGSAFNTLSVAEGHGVRFLEQSLGVKTIEDARKIDARALLEKGLAFGGIRIFEPNVDGYFLTEDPTQILLKNKHHKIPYLFGHTSGEGGWAPPTIEAFEAQAKATYGVHADKFLELCNVKTKKELDALYKTEAFNPRAIGNYLFCRTQAEQGGKSYAYYFDPVIPGEDNPGVFHSSDLWFVFETLAKCWRPFVGKHYDLARQMCNYWSNFAKNGDPNGPDADGTPMPEWKPYTSEDKFVIRFGDKSERDNRELSDLLKFRLDFYLGKL